MQTINNETNKSLSNELLEAALKYLSLGFSVIPVGENKIPAITWKEFQTRKATEQEVRSWFSNPGVVGVGIVTGKISGLAVLDMEAGADFTGLKIPTTPTSKTGGGGAHYYFKYPSQGKFQNSVRFLPLMDTRGDGGYVIAPPSLHSSGKHYEWSIDFEQSKLAAVPKWVKDKMEVQKTATVNDWKDKLENGVGRGQRNESAASVVGGLISKHPSDRWEAIVWPLVLDWNLKNDPPLPENELRSTFVSIANRERTKEDQPDKNTPEEVGYITSMVTPEHLVEMIYDEKDNKAQLVIFNRQDKTIKTANVFSYKGKKFLPYPTTNTIINKKFILLPSECGPQLKEAELLSQIQGFIKKYLTVSEIFEELIPHYIQLTWIHDKFDTIPYLRATGDFGVGKSRFLQSSGILCRKPFFAGGATTPSPIFRIIDEFSPTLIIDEADFSNSDAKAEIVKILNCGFMKNTPVLRSEPHKDKPFDPRVFEVFCPKIIATREKFSDDALESRCLTEDMDVIARKKDVVLNIPANFQEEALQIRNNLLRWRFDNFDKIVLDESLNDPQIADRLNQITLPIKCLITNPVIREDFGKLLRRYHQNIIINRGMEKEASVLEKIIELHGEIKSLTMKEISIRYNFGLSAPDQLSPQKVGNMVRGKLKLGVERKNGGYTVIWDDKAIEKLKIKFGIFPEEENKNEVPPIEEVDKQTKLV